MKVFLTGGSGFLGYHIAAVFLKEGWNVTGLVRRSSKTDHLRKLGVELHTGELLYGDGYRNAMANASVVVHCAGAIQALSYKEFHKVNALGAGEVARVASESGVRRFILISSLAARGPFGVPEGPVSDYGRSKLEGEREVVARAGGMEVVIVRPPVIFGQGDRGLHSVFWMAHKGWFPLYGDGQRRLSIVHGKDVARGVFLLASHKGDVPSGPYYPADPSNPTWLELAGLFEEALKRRLKKLRIPGQFFKIAAALSSGWGTLVRKAPLFSLDKEREMRQESWACSSKALTDLTGWTPEASLIERISETHRWYLDNGWL